MAEERPRFRYVRAMRLVHQNDFDRAYREGRRARGALITVVLRPNGLAHSRLGLSVGKRAYRGAVERNRARRVLREAFRLSYAQLPAGCDIVTIASTPGAEMSLAAVQPELVKLARKAHARLSEPPPPRREPKPAERAEARGASDAPPPASERDRAQEGEPPRGDRSAT